MRIITTILLFGLLFSSCGEDRKSKRGSAKAKKEAAKKPTKKNQNVKEMKVSAEKKNVVEMKKSEPIPKDQLNFAKKLIKSIDKSEIEAVDGAKVFKMSCAICHGRKGDMSINGSKILKDTKTSLAHRVAQVYFGKGTMTPFKGILKDKEVIAVSSYIDELKK